MLLRWSPCDSPLHAVGCELLPASTKALRGSRKIALKVAIQAMEEMDAEGLFGQGAEREAVVLSLWMGDQSNVERYRYALRLNPPAVAKRFGAEMNAGIRAFYKAHFPDLKAPKDDVFK